MFDIKHQATGSRARVGRLETPQGVVKTPAYVIVATYGKVIALSPAEVSETKTQILIANTFHLWQKLGEEGLKNFPGLHQYMSWQGPIMTDSGGFQVFSLGAAREHKTGKIKTADKKQNADGSSLVKVGNKGVEFKTDQGQQFLDAKKSIEIQNQLGADIIFAFDEPSSPQHSREYTKKALKRTHRWAKQSIAAHQDKKQLLFGIVQGGKYSDLREKSARFLNQLDFDGFGIGGSFGSSFGGSKGTTSKELEATIPYLDKKKPRHLMGIGRVEDLFVGVRAGIDLFDCVIPTREARHGRLYTGKGIVNIRNSKYGKDEGQIDANCRCPVCLDKTVSRGKLRKMFKTDKKRAGSLATAHNVWFFNNLMAKMRKAIKENSLDSLEKKYLKYY